MRRHEDGIGRLWSRTFADRRARHVDRRRRYLSCGTFALSLIPSFRETLDATGDRLGSRQRPCLGTAEEDREDLAYRAFGEHEADCGEDGAPGNQRANRREQGCDASPGDLADHPSVSWSDDLDDRKQCWERTDRKGRTHHIGDALHSLPLVPDAKSDQRRRERPSSRPEPRSENVSQRIGKESPSREEQTDGEHHAGHCEGEKDECSAGGSADDSGAVVALAASLLIASRHATPRRPRGRPADGDASRDSRSAKPIR